MTTLATVVTIHRIDGFTRLCDVPVNIERRGKYTDIEFDNVTNEIAVTVRLTEGERIAFIESLGGKP
jgi:hypothetical protein